MVSEEAAKFIGRTGEPLVMEVERGAIKRYAEAIDDLNPLYTDEEHARNSRYGSIITPPGFFGWPAKAGGPRFGKLREELMEALSKAGFSRVLDGGIELEFFLPIRAGDVLVATPRIADVQERQAKAGSMILGIQETSYVNQHGELVAVARQTMISR